MSSKMMDSKITKLKQAALEPDQDGIEILERALDLAKSGEMREVAIYGSMIGNDMYRAASFIDVVTLIGSLEMLKDIIKETSR